MAALKAEIGKSQYLKEKCRNNGVMKA